MKKIGVLICLMFGLTMPQAISKTSLTNVTMEITAAAKVFTYIDGNNNKYLITKLKVGGGTIEYIPITKENSSSGEYNGGKPYKINISDEEYKSVTALMTAGTKDAAQLNEERNMGSGTIILPKNKVFFLKMDSYNKSAIEKKLKELKNKYLVTESASTKSNGDTLIIEGKIVERSFESKKGVMTDIKEFYFIPTDAEIAKNKLAKEYFVKLSKGKIHRDVLKTYVGKSGSWKVIVMRGLWDADDNTHQSRFGDYVILLESLN